MSSSTSRGNHSSISTTRRARSSSCPDVGALQDNDPEGEPPPLPSPCRRLTGDDTKSPPITIQPMPPGELQKQDPLLKGVPEEDPDTDDELEVAVRNSIKSDDANLAAETLSRALTPPRALLPSMRDEIELPRCRASAAFDAAVRGDEEGGLPMGAHPPAGSSMFGNYNACTSPTNDLVFGEVASDEDLAEEAAYRVLGQCFGAGQHALCKTVANDDWEPLLQRLTPRPPRYNGCFRTSCSLPPPGAVGMRLYGMHPEQNCAGLVWDARQLVKGHGGEEVNWWAWPSGYNAKTEFNLIDSGTKLINGRQEALVSVAQLREHNRFHLRNTPAATGDPTAALSPLQPLPPAPSVNAVNSVVSSGMSPVVSAPPTAPITPPITTGAETPQLDIAATPNTTLIRGGVLPFNEVYAPMGPKGHGLLALFTRSRERQHLLHLLQLRDLVTSSLGLSKSFAGSSDQGNGHSQAPPVLLLVLPRDQTTGTGVQGAFAFTRAAEAAFLHSLAKEGVRPEPWVTSSLGLNRHMLGAYVAMGALRSGQTARRLSEAISQVDAWLLRSASVAFRVRTKTRQGATLAFVGNKAIVNRTRFRKQLVSVQKALLESSPLSSSSTNGKGKDGGNDGNTAIKEVSPTKWVEEFREVVSGFNKPCMRLELTQHVLGLDGRWERDAILGTLDALCDLLDSTKV